ncbi:alpha/beta hydrolase [Streptomyces sp. M19]
MIGHSMGQTKARSLEHAKFLHDAGYTVALFDHRNHGSSSDDHALTGLGDRFANDIVEVVHHLRRRQGTAPRASPSTASPSPASPPCGR